MSINVVLNTLWAATATGVSLWVAARSSGIMRWALSLQGILAMFYTLAYGWLVFNLEHQREWSRTIVWVGNLSWPVAWIFMPIAYYIGQKHLVARINRETDIRPEIDA